VLVGGQLCLATLALLFIVSSVVPVLHAAQYLLKLELLVLPCVLD